MLRVIKIRMEYLEHPVGLGGLPWFGWVLDSDRKNVVQKAYQLQIAREPQFENMIYDSGFVESSESVHVEVPAYREDDQTEEGAVGQEGAACREGGAGQEGAVCRESGEEREEAVCRESGEEREGAPCREGGAGQERAGCPESGDRGESCGSPLREKLRSCTEYFVRVRVSDGVEESPYSGTASFVTGILNRDEWQAEFITAEEEADSVSSGSTCLTKQIRIDGKAASAYVCVTGLGLYRFFVNGEKAGDDEMTPGWTSYHKHLCYQTYDVTALLKEGENTLQAMLGAGWYKGKMGFLLRRNNYGTRTAFLMQLTVRYEDGREEVFVTDNSWQGRPGPVTFSEIYDGEHYDARLERESMRFDVGETDPEPGDRSTNTGEADPASEDRSTNTGEADPVSEDRSTKAGEADPEDHSSEAGETVAEPVRRKAGAGETDGKSTGAALNRDWKPVQVIPFPKETLTAQAGSRVGKMEHLQAREVLMTPKGETVIDFGQNLSGRVHFKVQAEEGSEIVLKCFETLDADGNVYTANLRSARQEIRYICRGGGREEYHPLFTFMGFRYVQVLKWPGEVKREDFSAYALYSRMEQTGTFRCSHPLVNRLQQNILWGLKGNFLDIPTDCPQRDERVGWTGDAQIFCRTACYLMNAYTFFRKWLKDVAADQTPEGGVPHVVPDIISGKEEGDWLLSQGTHSAAAWADVAVINPWTLYLIYGDRTILEEQYDSMKKWIGFMEAHSVDYIWNYKLQFGDWVALDAEEGSYFGATPNDLTCTAYFAYSTGLFAKIADILGKPEDAAYYGALYEKILEKFRDTFFTDDGYMTAQTQTAHIVALYFNLTPEAFRQQTAKRLVELLRKEGGHLVTGFVGTPYFCHVLSSNGYVKEAYELLLKEDFPSWLYQVKMGATTVWEHWDGLKPDGTMWSPDMNSFNHYAYGAVGDWLYRVVLGMEPDQRDPGYHHSVISPQTGDAFDFAEGAYESVYGTLRVHWEKGKEDQNVRRLLITIPHNTTAEIRLEKGACRVRAKGLEFVSEEGILTARCGSGQWEVSYLHE